MQVRSKPGTKCPMEGRPRAYVTDSDLVEVPDTAYYRRLIDDGSLEQVSEEPQGRRTAPGKGGKS